MSCCPPAPRIVVAEINPDEPTLGPEVQRIPGEPEDCYMARRGNVSETGRVDDKTEAIEDKIVQNAIVPDSSASINLQFSTTGPTPIDNWEFDPPSFPGVTLNTTTGVMSGTFDPSVRGQKLQLRVKAKSGSTVIDDRTYIFTASVYNAGDAIQLLHPLPGSVVTSGFGPRRPPASGASSQHMALDFAYPGGKIGEVLCAADGEVVLARPGTGYGNYVMVKHTDSAGQHLITTLYAHLDQIYVAVGQKVTAGQKIGREGNTGIGSGPHLHFEVRLPNNTRIDPTPYLRGEVTASSTVTPDNQPGGGIVPIMYASGSRGIISAEVQARQGCPQYGSSYPAPGPGASAPPVQSPSAPASSGLPPPGITDPFELAWFFVMTHEVNSLWMTAPDRTPIEVPPNPVWQGLIDTQANRQRVGYVEHPKDPGGATKFGIAQRFNPSVNVNNMDYQTARSIGYNSYWLAPQVNCATIAATSPRIAVMAFDMNYLMGPSACKTVLTTAGVTGTETGAAELQALEKIHEKRLAYLQTRPGWTTFGKGWTKRALECLSYCRAL